MSQTQERKEETNSSAAGGFEKLRRMLFLLLALVAVGCAVARVSGVTSVDRDVLLFLGTAGVFLVLERITKLSIGKEGISYEIGKEIKEGINTVQNQVTKVQQATEENQRAITDGVGGKTLPTPTLEDAEKAQFKLPPVKYEYDPQKERFGESPSRNGRRLSAEVRPASGSPGNYDVILKVEAEEGSTPLIGDVTFYLHDTFRRPVRVVPVRDGVARLELLAYGAFTVGAVADEGQTLLELDLSKDKRFPEKFRLS